MSVKGKVPGLGVCYQPRGGLGCKGVHTFTLKAYNWAKLIFSAFVIVYYLILISETIQFFHLEGKFRSL